MNSLVNPMENPMENPHENPIAGAVADVDSEASGASCCASGFFLRGIPGGSLAPAADGLMAPSERWDGYGWVKGWVKI